MILRLNGDAILCLVVPATKAQFSAHAAHADAAALATLDSGFVQQEWTGGQPPVSGDELTGTVLNETYRVERIIGEGGMGRVYEARHARIAQKQVAVKVLHRQFASDREALARFQREAEAAASISHPNVVAVLDVDRTPNGMPYMVCEYLQGIDLAEYIKRVGTLDLATAVHVARQLCDGLAAAHARGVIHRDLKPQNVFLVGDFTTSVPVRPLVKIVDFGLSRILHADAQLTQAGIIMGTPAYMPPEQALGHKADHRADVYGVGACLYKALSGHAPYERDTPHAAVIAVMTTEPPRVRALDPSIPAQAELVIERAMARDPAQRYADTQELARALDELELAQQPDSADSVTSQDLPAPGHPPLPVLEAPEAHGARTTLVLWLLAAAATLTCATPVAVTGLEHMLPLSLSRLELGVAVGLSFAVWLVSGALVIGDIRRHVWRSTSRVAFAAGHARACLLAAVAAFGFGHLALHLHDDFLTRVMSHSRLLPLGAAWLGWNLVLPLVAAVAAGTVHMCRKLLLDTPRSWTRLLGAWLVIVVGLVLSGAVVYGSLLWRAAMPLRK